MDRNRNKVVHSQGRQIGFNVYEFMKREKDTGELVIPLNRIQELVAEATGVSLSTVKRIVNENNAKPAGSKFNSPRKTISKPSPKSTVDQFDGEIIRNVIYTFVNIHKRRPTMKSVFEAVKDNGVELLGKVDSFRKIVHKLGFRWKKAENNRKVLIEKPDISAKRTEFLRKLKKYRDEGHSVLRLPPYHPQLNPIEKICAIVKNEVAACNTTFKMDDVLKLTTDILGRVSPDTWKNVCTHVEKIEDEYLSREYIVDEVQELIIIINKSDESEFNLTTDSDSGDDELE